MLAIFKSTQKGGWQVLGLLFAIGAVNYADRTAFSAIFPLMKRDLGMSDVQLGAIGSLFLAGYGLMSPLAGWAGDRFARGSMVTCSLLAWSVTTGLSGLVMSIHQLYAARILLGLSEALYMPAALALLAEYFSSRDRGLAFSIHNMGLQLGFILGGYLSGFVGDRSGWRASLFILAAVGLSLAAISHGVLRGRRSEPPPATRLAETNLGWREGYAILLRIPSFYFLLLEAMISSIATWVFAYWLPLYYSETFGMSLARAALYGTVALSAGGWIGTISGGWLSDRVTVERGSRQRMLLQLGCYALAAPLLLCFLGTFGYRWITAAVFLFGLLLSLGASNASPLLFDVTTPGVWGRAVGLLNTTNCLAGALGIYAAGFFKAQLGLRRVFAGISGTTLLAAGLLLFCYLVLLEKDLRRRDALAALEPTGA